MARIAHLSNRVARTCQQCGVAFESYPSQPRKFCSRTCMGTYNAGRAMPLKPRTGRYKQCEQCGAEFWVIKSDDARRRHCSKQCYDGYQRRLRVMKTCPVCSMVFEVKPFQATWNGKGQTFCSRTCMGIAKTKRPLTRMHNGKPARLDEPGYVWVWEPDHPESKRYKGWMAEHRIVAEQHLGRRLTAADEVHHVNRVKDDNRPENLQVLDGVTHAIITAQQRLTDRELIAEYRKRFGPI